MSARARNGGRPSRPGSPRRLPPRRPPRPRSGPMASRRPSAAAGRSALPGAARRGAPGAVVGPGHARAVKRERLGIDPRALIDAARPGTVGDPNLVKPGALPNAGIRDPSARPSRRQQRRCRELVRVVVGRRRSDRTKRAPEAAQVDNPECLLVATLVVEPGDERDERADQPELLDRADVRVAGAVAEGDGPAAEDAPVSVEVT